MKCHLHLCLACAADMGMYLGYFAQTPSLPYCFIQRNDTVQTFEIKQGLQWMPEDVIEYTHNHQLP
uniref:Uncharacterized protein n=1 Tax=Arion vulgaris TaxID=1028688 RepID=A0A0B7BUQ0_9EUPU